MRFIRVGRRFLDCTHQGVRGKRLCEIGDATGVNCGFSDRGAVVCSNVNDRNENARCCQLTSEVDSRFSVKVDIQHEASSLVQTSTAMEVLDGTEQFRVEAISRQNPPNSLEHAGVVI